MTTINIDPTYGRQVQSHLFLQYLSQNGIGLDGDGIVFCSTMPFCNCREQGFVLNFYGAQKRGALNFAFFEHRNSDSLCALKWIGYPPVSGCVTPDDLPEGTFPDKWTHAATFEAYKFYEASEWLREQLEQFIKGA